MITPPSGRPRFPPRNVAIRQRPPVFTRPPQPQHNTGKRKLDHVTSEQQVKDLRQKIPRLDFKDTDPTPCNLHQSFEDIDQDAGLLPEKEQELKDPLDVVDEGILDKEDSNDEEVVDPAPVDSSILLYQEIGEVIDNQWTDPVTCKILNPKFSNLHTFCTELYNNPISQAYFYQKTLPMKPFLQLMIPYTPP